MECLVAELLLERLALRDVSVVHDDAADRRVVEQVLRDRLEHPEGPVAVTRSELERGFGPGHGRHLVEPSLDGGTVVGMDGSGRRAPDRFVRENARAPVPPQGSGT